MSLSQSGSRYFSRRFTRIFTLSLLAIPMSGCATLGYLLQAGKGQMAMIQHARPIPEVIADVKTEPRIQRLLSEIPQMKTFGEANGIKPTRNYTEYVKLDRDAASYVVSACEPLKFKSKEWKFPIVGAFPYLGWFNLDSAKEHVAELKAEGWDVDLRGAGAYSTLGWFRDPVVSTMIGKGDRSFGYLTNVILHESVHATVYIYGQAYFNESLASFVADRLTYDYMATRIGKDSPEYVAYQKGESEFHHLEKRLHEVYGELDALYQSPKPDAEKLKTKAEILARVSTELGFKRELNNATLIQYKTYSTGGAEFEVLLKACAGNWQRFLSVLGKVKAEDFSKTQQEDLTSLLGGIAARGC